MPSDGRNRILSTMAADHREALVPALERVELPNWTTLVEPDVDTRYVHFLDDGLASVVASSSSGEQQIEVGHIGFEGITGFHVVLGMARTPTHTFMQVAGSGWRLSTEDLYRAMSANEGLRLHLLRYVQTYQIQLSYSALANGRYTIPQRLARWLLMAHDRLGTDAMPLTHEFLALMLGVRRSGVTNELHVLEGEHIIRASRGRIEIRDRARLERLAGETYGVPEAAYEAVFGRIRPLSARAGAKLRDMRIFLVEDDFHLATQMQRYLASQGAVVVGPAPSVQSALRTLIATPQLDAAIVDVNLRGEMSFPLAEALRKRGVPFIFVSGYQKDLIPAHFADVSFHDKPIEPSELAAALLAVA
ncbi:helix-turn-helix domain-containing protein [Aureimonas phyllosphaerae]|uniref:CRP-like cAMP-binding protein/CheY-like chemotaxis protein n=1 Tax=Aureimonas phyllosphaerae TaxID=1166078 RepID=A0A7W6BPW3_9HYPH|nr:helix-turn-helix domain-containing protein [Aureimonas phyllosphaerae]MBB3934100.1 CRP-like cAMP-binding protein/CheY-like chemotaxis protein [Aureimonas phyllosphaerae]MBB3958684.1 CRP-like cAMP-binding protein/CheY-like chemotaxis protein [Aureimonas phyllosphaerae]SFF17940.1 cAMP-binding domain of CRP or a regulatory subunit of cAMP-dependent protein kinases [Aureimonas phyllosphaerae]